MAISSITIKQTEVFPSDFVSDFLIRRAPELSEKHKRFFNLIVCDGMEPADAAEKSQLGRSSVDRALRIVWDALYIEGKGSSKMRVKLREDYKMWLIRQQDRELVSDDGDKGEDDKREKDEASVSVSVSGNEPLSAAAEKISASKNIRATRGVRNIHSEPAVYFLYTELSSLGMKFSTRDIAMLSEVFVKGVSVVQFAEQQKTSSAVIYNRMSTMAKKIGASSGRGGLDAWLKEYNNPPQTNTSTVQTGAIAEVAVDIPAAVVSEDSDAPPERPEPIVTKAEVEVKSEVNFEKDFTGNPIKQIRDLARRVEDGSLHYREATKELGELIPGFSVIAVEESCATAKEVFGRLSSAIISVLSYLRKRCGETE